MNPDCIFCKIVAGDLPSDIVLQNEYVTAFHDINPAAPKHVLIVPNEHLVSLEDLTPEKSALAAQLLLTVKAVAAQEGINETGYRVIANTGPDSHQEVPHLHVHVLGGHPMKHPMG